MIEINLLPEELKVKSRKGKVKLSLDAKYFIYIVPFIFGLLICVHVYLAVVGIVKQSQFSILNRKWEAAATERKKLEEFNKEYSILSMDTNEIKQLTQDRINWSNKLNSLSLKLPSGIWFNELTISSRDFTLHASAVSLLKDETSLIKELIDNLKNDPLFNKDFKSLELSSTQRRTIGGYDIVDFVLLGTSNSK